MPVAMIEPAFGASLVPPIGAAPLPEPDVVTAGKTAIALPAIAVQTKARTQQGRFASGLGPPSRKLRFQMIANKCYFVVRELRKTIETAQQKQCEYCMPIANVYLNKVIE